MLKNLNLRKKFFNFLFLFLFLFTYLGSHHLSFHPHLFASDSTYPTEEIIEEVDRATSSQWLQLTDRQITEIIQALEKGEDPYELRGQKHRSTPMSTMERIGNFFHELKIEVEDSKVRFIALDFGKDNPSGVNSKLVLFEESFEIPNLVTHIKDHSLFIYITKNSDGSGSINVIDLVYAGRYFGNLPIPHYKNVAVLSPSIVEQLEAGSHEVHFIDLTNTVIREISQPEKIGFKLNPQGVPIITAGDIVILEKETNTVVEHLSRKKIFSFLSSHSVFVADQLIHLYKEYLYPKNSVDESELSQNKEKIILAVKEGLTQQIEESLGLKRSQFKGEEREQFNTEMERLSRFINESLFLSKKSDQFFQSDHVPIFNNLLSYLSGVAQINSEESIRRENYAQMNFEIYKETLSFVKRIEELLIESNESKISTTEVTEISHSLFTLLYLMTSVNTSDTPKGFYIKAFLEVFQLKVNRVQESLQDLNLNRLNLSDSKSLGRFLNSILELVQAEGIQINKKLLPGTIKENPFPEKHPEVLRNSGGWFNRLINSNISTRIPLWSFMAALTAYIVWDSPLWFFTADATTEITLMNSVFTHFGSLFALYLTVFYGFILIPKAVSKILNLDIVKKLQSDLSEHIKKNYKDKMNPSLFSRVSSYLFPLKDHWWSSVFNQGKNIFGLMLYLTLQSFHAATFFPRLTYRSLAKVFKKGNQLKEPPSSTGKKNFSHEEEIFTTRIINQWFLKGPPKKTKIGQYVVNRTMGLKEFFAAMAHSHAQLKQVLSRFLPPNLVNRTKIDSMTDLLFSTLITAFSGKRASFESHLNTDYGHPARAIDVNKSFTTNNQYMVDILYQLVIHWIFTPARRILAHTLPLRFSQPSFTGASNYRLNEKELQYAERVLPFFVEGWKEFFRSFWPEKPNPGESDLEFEKRNFGLNTSAFLTAHYLLIVPYVLISTVLRITFGDQGIREAVGGGLIFAMLGILFAWPLFLIQSANFNRIELLNRNKEKLNYIITRLQSIASGTATKDEVPVYFKEVIEKIIEIQQSEGVPKNLGPMQSFYRKFINKAVTGFNYKNLDGMVQEIQTTLEELGINLDEIKTNGTIDLEKLQNLVQSGEIEEIFRNSGPIDPTVIEKAVSQLMERMATSPPWPTTDNPSFDTFLTYSVGVYTTTILGIWLLVNTFKEDYLTYDFFFWSVIAGLAIKEGLRFVFSPDGLRNLVTTKKESPSSASSQNPKETVQDPKETATTETTEAVDSSSSNKPRTSPDCSSLL